jgi:hypothetical protein
VQGFFAYPANPSAVGEVIEAAIARLRQRSFEGTVTSWREVDVAGNRSPARLSSLSLSKQ